MCYLAIFTGVKEFLVSQFAHRFAPIIPLPLFPPTPHSALTILVMMF